MAMGAAADTCQLTGEVSRIHRIPRQGLGYTSFSIPLSRWELQRYRKAAVIKRWYRMGPYQFMLIAVDGEWNRHAVHDPMYCFTGAGWKIESRETAPIEAGACAVLHLRNGAATRDVAYWFSDGTRRHASVVRYWVQATLRRVTMHCSGKEPILVMLQTIEGNPVNLVEVMNQFGALFEV